MDDCDTNDNDNQYYRQHWLEMADLPNFHYFASCPVIQRLDRIQPDNRDDARIVPTGSVRLA